MPNYLEIKNLGKRYSKITGLEDVSFSCEEGSFTVILGPSGAGKTTTLNIIAGILQETSGDVFLNGKSMRMVRPQERNVSMVFEDYSLYPTFSIYENIASPLRARKLPKAEIDSKVKHIAQMLGIEAHLDKLPSQVSGGQKQRTALARCLIRDAEIYLLDEPIAHLDAKLRHRMRGEFKRIHKDLGKTMIYVTHDYREALSLADNIIVLNKGRVVQIGTPEDVFFRPYNVFVATLLGEPPMNLVRFKASVAADSVVTLSNGGTRITLPGKAAGQVPENVKLGFRHSTSSLQVGAGENCIEGSVYVFELMEDGKIFSLMVGDDLVKIVTPRDAIFEINQHAFIKIDPSALCVFDAESGVRIEMRG